MKMLRGAVLLVGVLALTLGGCKEEPKGGTAPAAVAQAQASPTPAAAPAAAPVDHHAAALEVFATRCTPCHGAKGEGDGAASATLTPKPRNLTDAKWQAEASDDHIEKIVLYGGAAVGKSPAMPANPDFDQKPELVKALRAHIRSLKKP